jgi:YfiR/HmsC-like
MKNANRSLLPRRSAALKVFCQCVLFGAAYIFCHGTQQALAENLPPPDYDDNNIKADYLCKFIRYVDWPSYGDTITIGVLGDNPVGAALTEYNGTTVKGRRVVIKELDSLRDAQKCQIIFVSSSEKQRLQEIFENLRYAHVLTVGEMKGFAQGGGMINFVGEKNKIHFEINVEAASRTGLNISPELLKLAKLVKS